MQVLVCPVCRITAMEEREGTTRISYDFPVWAASCTHHSMSSLLLCPNMRPLLKINPSDAATVVEVRDKSRK